MSDTEIGTTPMSKDDEILEYITKFYESRLKRTREIMAKYLDEGRGSPSEITRRIEHLDTLMAMVKSGQHAAAAEFAITHGIKRSLLRGGRGYPPLTGAHYDYIVTVFPERTEEIWEMIVSRPKSSRMKTKK